MPTPTPCAVHASYVQCPERDTCTETPCPHKEPHYPIPYNLGFVSVSCRVGDRPSSGEGCPGCEYVSKEVMQELMESCHICKQPAEEDE